MSNWLKHWLLLVGACMLALVAAAERPTAERHQSGSISIMLVDPQNFDGFKKTVDGLGDNPELAQQAYELYAKKDWAALETLFTEQGLNGGWPPNRGFIDRKPGTMEVGTKFDRFGGWIDKNGDFQDKGTFVADYGADFGGRALPQSKLDGDAATGKGPDEFRGYEVLKPIPMVEGEAIPWFGQPGGGKQYELSMGINELKAGGFIREIAAPNLQGGDGTTTQTNGEGGEIINTGGQNGSEKVLDDSGYRTRLDSIKQTSNSIFGPQ